GGAVAVAGAQRGAVLAQVLAGAAIGAGRDLRRALVLICARAAETALVAGGAIGAVAVRARRAGRDAVEAGVGRTAGLAIGAGVRELRGGAVRAVVAVAADDVARPVRRLGPHAQRARGVEHD